MKRAPHWSLADPLLLLVVLLWILPALGLLVTSLRPPGEIVSSGWWQARRFVLDNYLRVLSGAGMGRAFLNSLLITIPATLLPLLLAAFAAYPLAFKRFPGRRAAFIGLIALQIVPLQTTLIPVLTMLGRTGLAGTFRGLWLAHTAYGLPFCVYLFRNFFGKIPQSLIESASMDGASDLRIFLHLILPLSLPVFATLFIFQFLWVWNDLLIALVYLGGTPDVAPLTVRIASLSGSLESGWHILSAAAFLSLILPLCVFFLLQRYFIKGVLSGAVKG